MEVALMSLEARPFVDDRLVQAWRRTLPTTLDAGDQAEVMKDEADPHGLFIHIKTAGRTGYTFDFTCSYQDEREVRVNLVDVEKDGIHVDERTEVIQTLVED